MVLLLDKAPLTTKLGLRSLVLLASDLRPKRHRDLMGNLRHGLMMKNHVQVPSRSPFERERRRPQLPMKIESVHRLAMVKDRGGRKKTETTSVGKRSGSGLCTEQLRRTEIKSGGGELKRNSVVLPVPMSKMMIPRMLIGQEQRRNRVEGRRRDLERAKGGLERPKKCHERKGKWMH